MHTCGKTWIPAYWVLFLVHLRPSGRHQSLTIQSSLIKLVWLMCETFIGACLCLYLMDLPTPTMHLLKKYWAFFSILSMEIMLQIHQCRFVSQFVVKGEPQMIELHYFSTVLEQHHGPILVFIKHTQSMLPHRPLWLHHWLFYLGPYQTANTYILESISAGIF